MDLAHVVGRRFADTDHDYDAPDSLLYALALGFRSDPLDADELRYVCECLPGRPERVRALAARFVQPMLPGDTVRVEIFDAADGAIRFRATAVDRGVGLIDRGIRELAG